MENSNLPARLLQQEYFVNFLSTSPHATSPEQLSEIRKIINDTEKNPIRCFNADTKRHCGVILRVPSLLADNPQQAEEASHIGGQSNKFCRRCEAGGTHKEKESDEGYEALFAVGVLRSAGETKEVLNRQLKAAMTGVAARVEELQTQTGTKDKVTEYWIQILLKRARDLSDTNPGKTEDELVNELTEWLEAQPGDKMNPLLDIAGLDPTQDTPVEILHTILLGIVKYVWHMFHSKLSDDEQTIFVTRLQSTDTDGLTIPPLRASYMMQYRNGLIGKHFKALIQTMAFHVHDLTTPAEFQVIKAVGELGAVLWVPEINDMNQYLSDLEILVSNVLDAFSGVDPSKITCKIKLHLLTHLISDCRRYGPAIHNSTEIFECFNAVFHMCSILSNHQAPSHDIAQKFASMDRLKHILSGGYWPYKGQWIQASPRVRRLLKTDTTIQQHLGWVPPQKIDYGKVNPLAAKKRQPIDWKHTNAFSVYPGEVNSLVWNQNRSVIAQSGDTCTRGSWVTVRRKDQRSHFAIGRLHDCRFSGCKATGSRVIQQERKETSRSIPIIQHANDDNFIINTHALHNSTLLRELLPRELTQPKPFHQDRPAYHAQVARELRVVQTEKQKTTEEKKKATRERNKQAKAAREGQKSGDKGSEPSIEPENQVESHRAKKRMRVTGD
ncbi:hypothetical protein K435DRAFT_876542 [Dendrothele bispora CBS 962.96]|uniref:Uncharacterized protein n=1 Tax=Dendrothele bispora (strain CBS 962.96) TaxID=1314807 RepID=A0A4S8KS60_DENBC|nr:hypothetical protein K435DRAFT_876542 [Dendrothele bispora CBS 962.96]